MKIVNVLLLYVGQRKKKTKTLLIDAYYRSTMLTYNKKRKPNYRFSFHATLGIIS